MATEIEELYVKIGGDVGNLLADAKKGIGQAENELKKFEQNGKHIFEEVGKAAKKLGSMIQSVQATVSGLTGGISKAGKGLGSMMQSVQAMASGLVSGISKAAKNMLSLQTVAASFVAIFAGQKITSFFVDLGKSVIGANAQFETFSTQFETLLGSAGAAQQRLDELAEFGIETPFELPQVVEASRVLQVFGGDALATGESLRMIGDIAAGVNQPFQDVAFWIGRAYDAMQSGRPWGEAAMRLQEMGALSGQARAELEALQKSGASGAEVWARFNELVGSRFAGNMERLSATFQGIMSNLNDLQGNLMRVGGQPFFEEAREDAGRLLDILSDEEMNEAIQNLARALGEAAAQLMELAASPALDALEGIEPETISDLAESIRDAAAALGEFSDRKITADLNGLIQVLTLIIDVFTGIVNTANRVKTALEPIEPIVKAIGAVFTGILFPVMNVIKAFGELNDMVALLTGQEIVDFSRDLADASETQEQAAERASQAAQNYGEAVAATFGRGGQVEQAMTDGAETIGDNSEKMTGLLEKFSEEMIDLSEERQVGLEELEKGHAEKIAEIETDYIDDRLELGRKMTDELVELDKETAKRRAEILDETTNELASLDRETADRRADILASTRERLADLARDTDQELAGQRQEFEREELRETEDHLLEMRRLREQYLVDVEEAVKNRDARALVDARRRFQQEQQEKEQDFSTGQQRDREDQDLRLQQIVENEQRRAEEIMLAQERELAKLAEQEQAKREQIRLDQEQELIQLAEQEQVKREQIETSYQEQFSKLEERHSEQLARENEQYIERQTQLDEALARRLETIAKELADEKAIDEEGAQAILETLNEVFGAGGEIDKLMEDFSGRRRKKLVVEVSLESKLPERQERRAPPGAGEGRGGSPIPVFQHGGTLLATRPTLAQFGEVPEMVQFMPLAQLNQRGMDRTINLKLEISGSAPPGLRGTERDQIAGILVNALREAGLRVSA